MDELGKVKRVIEKKASVDDVLLVLDATVGQNGLAQARVFAEVVDITGVVLTKLDGTAKGGIVFQVQHELGVPVKLVGLGEGAVAGGGHAGVDEHLLHPRLGALEAGAVGTGAEHQAAGGPQLVGQAGDQRCLGPDDVEIGVDRRGLGGAVRREAQHQRPAPAHGGAVRLRCQCRGR